MYLRSGRDLEKLLAELRSKAGRVEGDLNSAVTYIRRIIQDIGIGNLTIISQARGPIYRASGNGGFPYTFPIVWNLGDDVQLDTGGDRIFAGFFVARDIALAGEIRTEAPGFWKPGVTGTSEGTPSTPDILNACLLQYTVIAGRPAAGFFGRAFISSDTKVVQVDNNAGWLDILPVDPVAGTPGLRTLGTGAQQIAAGNHSH